MILQAQQIGFPEIREVVSKIVREQTIPVDVVKAAREMLQTMCEEAAEYGLPPSDVIRTLLRPVFAMRRGCDCPTCKGRRDELGDGTPTSGSNKAGVNR